MIKLKLSYEPFNKARHDADSLVFYTTFYPDLNNMEFNVYENYDEYKNAKDREQMLKEMEGKDERYKQIMLSTKTFKHKLDVKTSPYLINRKFLYRPYIAILNNEFQYDSKPANCFFTEEKDAKRFARENTEGMLRKYSYTRKIKIKVFDEKNEYEQELDKKSQIASKLSQEERRLLGITDKGIKL